MVRARKRLVARFRPRLAHGLLTAKLPVPHQPDERHPSSERQASDSRPVPVRGVYLTMSMHVILFVFRVLLIENIVDWRNKRNE